jgi:uncharacterized protein
VSAGPLPDKAGSLTFKTLQTYSDGKIVRWVDVAQAGQAEPDHPAPTVRLTAAGSGGTGAASAPSAGAGQPAGSAPAAGSGSDGTARGLGIAGLVLGALGLGAGGFALLAGRRRTRG